MTVESPFSHGEPHRESTDPVVTTVDRVFTSPVKDAEFLTLTTAPVALFAQPLEGGSTRYTAQIGSEFSGTTLLRYLRTIAPYPKESLIGTIMDWGILYTGSHITKESYNNFPDQERIRLIQEHSRFLPPAWQTFMRHHVGPMIDAAADAPTINERPCLDVSLIERFLREPQDDANRDRLHNAGVVSIKNAVFRQRVIVNLHNRLLLEHVYYYARNNMAYVRTASMRRNVAILASTLSLMPVLQWETTLDGHRHVNTGPIEGDKEVEYGLQQLHEQASPLAQTLDNDPSRLSSLLGEMFLAYTTPDIRQRQRWEPREKLRPDQEARPVREPQVPIRVLETDFSDHPFLAAVESYVQKPTTRSEQLRVMRSSARHNFRDSLRGPFARLHPSDF